MGKITTRFLATPHDTAGMLANVGFVDAATTRSSRTFAPKREHRAPR